MLATDDYLRNACGLSLLDGPPVTLTLDQARAALDTALGDANLYRSNLVGAVIRSKPAPVPEPAAPYCNGQCGICSCQSTSSPSTATATPTK